MAASRLGTLALVTAAGVWLVVGAGLALAQPVPSNPDTDKRLQALEEKMERMLKLLEARAPQPATADDAALKAWMQSRDALQAVLEMEERQYATFRQTAPYLILRGTPSANIHAERLAELEKRRAYGRGKIDETRSTLEMIQKVRRDKGDEAALYWIRAAGVKTPSLDGSSDLDRMLFKLRLDREMAVVDRGPGHPEVQKFDKAIELARQLVPIKPNAGAAPPDDPKKPTTVDSYLKALEAEIEFRSTMLKTYEDMHGRTQTAAREWQEVEARDATFRQDIKQLRDMLATLDKKIREAKGPTPSK